MNLQYTLGYAMRKHTPGLIQLWKQCFFTTIEFNQLYFSKVYKPDETLILIVDDIVVAALQVIPYSIKIGNTIQSGGYISGAMTHPDYRKKGYMHKLLTASFDEMVKKGYDYTFLIPQEKELISMYAKYGFRLCEPNPQPPENKVLKTLKQWAQIRQNFFDENGILLENEPVFPNEQKGMIKRLNPAAEEITTLYMGMMLD